MLPQLEPPVDYDALQRKSREAYFSVLFDKERAKEMLSELVECIGQPDITVGGLNAENLHVDLNSSLFILAHAIRRNVLEGIKVKDAFIYIDWRNFFVIEAAAMLESNQDLQPTLEQKEELCATVCKAAREGAFQNVVRYDGESISIPLFTHALLFLAISLDCDLPQEAALHLTEIPEIFFDKDGKAVKYEYITKKISPEHLTAKVLEDLSMTHIGYSVLQDHIEYCGKVQSDGAVKTARRLCMEESSCDAICYVAFKYLYDRMGQEYIESEIIPNANGALLCHIATNYSNISRNVLKEAMEQRYHTSPAPTLQSILIAFGSQNALMQYAGIVCGTHALPEEEPEFGGSTSAVASVCNPRFLPLLGNLFETALSPDFRDREFDGLLGSLTKAFLNCGKEDADATISEVKSHLSDKCKDEKRIRRCNYIIEEVLRIKCANSDVPLEIEEVERLIRKI